MTHWVKIDGADLRVNRAGGAANAGDDACRFARRSHHRVSPQERRLREGRVDGLLDFAVKSLILDVADDADNRPPVGGLFGVDEFQLPAYRVVIGE